MESLARIVAGILFFSSLSLASASANENSLTAITMCSGVTLYIDFDSPKDPTETPQHQMTACHAICDDRDDMNDSEEA